jgi:Ca2+:H+ antiporter
VKRNEKIIIVLCVIVTLVSGILHFAGATPVLTFAVTGIALALLALMVGDATEQLGSRLGPGATGVLQASLASLPELFVAIFALRAGLAHVVQAALVGSILANTLLVFGLALFLGGLKNGTQTFRSGPPRMIASLMLLAVSALILPTLTTTLHTPGESHINNLDIFVAIVLLVLFVSSIYFSVKGDPALTTTEVEMGHAEWSMGLTIGVLAGAGLGAALVSDWFVEALQPAMATLGISEAFAGLVIVAIAGNAIENLIGIQFAWRNQMDYAVSLILNSALQIALGLFPILLLLSFFLGGAVLTFVLSPILVVSLALAAIVSAFIVFDGESIWLEGLALIGLYCIIAAAFWWG